VHYLLFYQFVPDYLQRRAQFREEHLKRAWDAHARGELMLGGAYAEPADGAALLFKGESPDVAERFAAADPYVLAGLVTRWHVRKWTTVAGASSSSPVYPSDPADLAQGVRALTHPDLSQLLELYRHLIRNDAPLPDADTVDKVWSESLSNPRMRHFGGFKGDVLVSACTICVVPNLTRGCRPYALIENVVTAADVRRQGWGRAVLDAAISFAWSQNCYKVMLLSGRKEEAVIRFYESAGFRSDEKRGYVIRSEESKT